MTSIADLRTRQRVFEEAVRLMAERGLYAGLLDEAAAAAACSPERARIYFRRDEDLVVALHERLAADFEDRVEDLPAGTIAQRFEAAMKVRLEQVAPFRRALRRLMAVLLDPESEHGVLGQHTETVRLRVGAVFGAVVLGATDCPPGPMAETLSRALYAVHLGLLLLWSQDRSAELSATRAAIELARDLLGAAGALAASPMAAFMGARVNGVIEQWLEPAPDPAVTEKAERVLRALFRHRRLLPDSGACGAEPCPQCLGLHLARTRRFVAAGLPVHLVLPAFPAKSPSPKKVLGKLPDRAEELALEGIRRVCDEIQAIHPPGARFTICSDGRVFSDLVGVTDDDVTEYGRALARMIERSGAATIDTFCTEDLFDLPSYDAMRQHVSEHYGEPLETVERRAEEHAHHRALWSGMQRFLFEDRVAAAGNKSRSALRKECGPLAHQVIQRSNAWTRVVSECFPTALRLSIHPQPPHSAKIGFRLMDTTDGWLTPWHGVAVDRGGVYTLMKREDAEALGGEVVEADGRPSHYVVPVAG